jgi:glucose/arabinose dehydrogenase
LGAINCPVRSRHGDQRRLSRLEGRPVHWRPDLEGGKVVGKEDLLRDAEYSFRDVVQGPDGYLYVATKDFDGIFKVVPGQ